MRTRGKIHVTKEVLKRHKVGYCGIKVGLGPEELPRVVSMLTALGFENDGNGKVCPMCETLWRRANLTPEELEYLASLKKEG